MARYRQAALAGVELGAATGIVVASVDLSSALLAPYAGSRAGLALYALALTVIMTSVAGGLLALLWTATQQMAARWQSRPARAIAALIDALPLAAFMLYPPVAWLSDQGLSPTGRAIAGAVLVALLAAAVMITKLSRKIIERVTQTSRGDLLIAGAGLALLAGAACYAADAKLLPDDYAEIHDGLAAAFVASVAVAMALLRWLLTRRAPRAALLTRRSLWVTAAALCVLLGVLEQLRVDAFRASHALVFGKLLPQARFLADVDGDGYAAVLGGQDCAPFDARRSPGTIEVPDNAIDEDCSGAAEPWPLGPPAPVAHGKPGAKPNILFITVDTLRADHLGTYGYSRRTSRNIDRLAKSSLVFERAFAQATKTWDSVPSFWTGMYPSNVPRAYRSERSRRRPSTDFYMKKDVELLAEALSAQGYTTNALVSSAFLTAIDLDRGFDRFKLVKDPTDGALKLLKKARAPFLLWLHYAGPHAPYKHSKKFDFGERPIDRYDGEIAREDAQIGKVLSQLHRRRLSGSTIVIINADHGEEFEEHGGRYHTRKHYRELLHVPLILRIPGVEPARVQDVVELVDIVPTLYELCSLPSPRTRFDGQSLLATLSAPRRSELGAAFSEDFHYVDRVRSSSLFDGRYRLIDDRRRGRLELYDVKSDPNEQRDIAAARPDLVSALRQRIAVRALRSRSPRVAGP
jgi:arylsulfatase A-like enzyme